MALIAKGKTVLGPDVITDGLVLYLDAANTQSYPGTGTNWYDLSPQKRNVTTNAVSYFVSGSTPYWYFPDVDNQRLTGNGGSGDFASGVTLEVWFSPENGSQNAGGFFEPLSFGTDQNRVYVYPTNSNPTYIYCQPRRWDQSTLTSTQVFTIGGWQQFVMKYYNNSGLGRIDWYRNGSYLSTSDDSGAYNYGSIGGNFFIGTMQNNSYKFKGKISIVKQYNRVLTALEITQNYLSMKGRFGLL